MSTMRSMRFALVILLPVCVLLVSCASTGTGPYAPQSERARDPQRAQDLTQRAAELIDTEPDKAESLLREALAADLYHGPAHNNLGVIHLNRGELYEAAGEFQWARRLMPGHPDPRLNLGLALERGGRVDDALAAYHAALEVYPDHLPTVMALAPLPAPLQPGRRRHDRLPRADRRQQQRSPVA